MWWWLQACVGPAAGPAEPAVDCTALPTEARSVGRIAVPAAEDLDFDRFGHVVSSDRDRVLFHRRDGEITAVIAGIVGPAGLRLLPDDDLLVADVTEGSLLRVTPEGGREVVHAGLNWPNGLAVLEGGDVLLSELSGDRVWRIEPHGTDSRVLAEVPRPNGIAVEPGGASALVGTMDGSGALLRLWLDDGRVETVASGLGAGFLDGVGVDVCGNAYVADIEGARLLRVRTDGAVETLAEAAPGEGWPALRWGSGVGGWEEDHLYLPEPSSGSILELDVGVPSAR